MPHPDWWGKGLACSECKNDRPVAQPENTSQNTDTRRYRSARYRVILAVGLLSALTLSGCGKNREYHILHQTDNTTTLITDAQQRVILNQKRLGKDDRRVGSYRIICAEPSPDVAQTFTEIKGLSLQLSNALFGKNNGSANDNSSANSLEAFSGVTNSLTKLGERLAVIQLFRDRMYRACEAYNNGALDAAGYTLMMARYDKTMATLLTAEIASGGFDQPLPLSSAPDNSSAHLGKMNEAIGQLSALQENLPADTQQDLADKLKKLVDMLRDEAQQLALQRPAPLPASLPTASVDGVDLAGEIGGIHRNFLDDSGIEPIIDACLVSFSKTERSISETRQAIQAEAAQEKLEDNFFWLEDLPTLLRIQENVNSGAFTLNASLRNVLALFDIKIDDQTGMPDKKALEQEINILSSFLIEDITGTKQPISDTSKFTEMILEELGKEGLISQSEKEEYDDGKRSLAELYSVAFSRLQDRVDAAKMEAKDATGEALRDSGNFFASFCLNQVLTGKRDTIIVRMLNSRKDLRKLAICEKLIDSRNSYDNNTVQMIVGACVKSMVDDNATK